MASQLVYSLVVDSKFVCVHVIIHFDILFWFTVFLSSHYTGVLNIIRATGTATMMASCHIIKALNIAQAADVKQRNEQHSCRKGKTEY